MKLKVINGSGERRASVEIFLNEMSTVALPIFSVKLSVIVFDCPMQCDS